MYKKVLCTCEVVVVLIKPIVFLTFSLSSASLDLKVSNEKTWRASHGLNRENKTYEPKRSILEDRSLKWPKLA